MNQTVRQSLATKRIAAKKSTNVPIKNASPSKKPVVTRKAELVNTPKTVADQIIENLGPDIQSKDLLVLITKSNSCQDKCKLHIMDYKNTKYLGGAYLTLAQGEDVKRSKDFSDYTVAIGCTAVGGRIDLDDTFLDALLKMMTLQIKPAEPKQLKHTEVKVKKQQQQPIKQMLGLQQQIHSLHKNFDKKLQPESEETLKIMLKHKMDKNLQKINTMPIMKKEAPQDKQTEDKYKPKPSTSGQNILQKKDKILPTDLLQIEIDHYVELISDPMKCKEKYLEELFDLAYRHKLDIGIRPDLGAQAKSQPQIEWQNSFAIFSVDFWKGNHLARLRLSEAELDHLVRSRPQIIPRIKVIADGIELTPFSRFWGNLLSGVCCFCGLSLLYDIFVEYMFYFYNNKNLHTGE